MPISTTPRILSTSDDAPREWRPVPGFSMYEISDHGELRSWHRTGPCPRRNPNGPALRHGNVDKLGYRRYNLSLGDGGQHRHYAHNLVLAAFVGPRPDGFHGSHLDGNPANNTATNLAWESPQANALRKNEHGTMLCGEKSRLSTLTTKKVLKIRALHAAGRSYFQISQRFHIPESNVRCVCMGRTWKHLLPPPAGPAT